MTTDPLLSGAITAYLGWPKAHSPTADRRALLEVAKEAATDAARLLADVESVIAASDDLPVADLTDQPDGGAAAYKGRLSGVRPDLSPDAIDALASRWFFHLRWLGMERGSDAPRYFVRYGGDGATPVPISLFRRRMVGGQTVDEILQDTDDWRPDGQSRIHHALAFPLDSDLEEVTGDEAGQFAEMVRSRRYVPFRATTPATALTRDEASVIARRFLSTPSETDGVGAPALLGREPRAR